MVTFDRVKLNHDQIKDNIRWRSGVILEDPDLQTTALIKADYEDKQIRIYVNGQQKRDYFSIIWRCIRKLNDSFEKLDYKELIPIPGYPEVSVAYKELIGLERMGQPELIIGEIGYRGNVSTLLNGIEAPEERIN